MNDLDRIENALATAKLDASVFERCAQDLLSEQYPGLSPIPGGSDWGRDADISSAEDPTPARLLVTSSRSLAGVRDNMLGGIKSLKAHGVSAHRIVLANPASLRLLERQKLVAAAQRAGVRLDASDISTVGSSPADFAETATGVRRSWASLLDRLRCPAWPRISPKARGPFYRWCPETKIWSRLPAMTTSS